MTERKFNARLLEYICLDSETILDLMDATTYDDKLIVVHTYMISSGKMTIDVCDELYALSSRSITGYGLVHKTTKAWLKSLDEVHEKKLSLRLIPKDTSVSDGEFNRRLWKCIPDDSNLEMDLAYSSSRMSSITIVSGYLMVAGLMTQKIKDALSVLQTEACIAESISSSQLLDKEE